MALRSAGASASWPVGSTLAQRGGELSAQAPWLLCQRGAMKTASGLLSPPVSGGHNITQDTDFGWSAGSEAGEDVEGNFHSP